MNQHVHEYKQHAKRKIRTEYLDLLMFIKNNEVTAKDVRFMYRLKTEMGATIGEADERRNRTAN